VRDVNQRREPMQRITGFIKCKITKHNNEAKNDAIDE
jgi:hypothetical protein